MIQAKINQEFCKGCGLCIYVCKKDVLEMGDGLNSKGSNYVIQKNPQNCIGCKACSTMCPEGAIELYKG